MIARRGLRTLNSLTRCGVSSVRRNCRSTSLLVVIGCVAGAGDAISIARFSVGVGGSEVLGN